jgi:hypothetical protein
VTIAEFDEIDGAVELVLPAASLYLVLVLVNLDERIRANQGKERVVNGGRGKLALTEKSKCLKDGVRLVNLQFFYEAVMYRHWR